MLATRLQQHINHSRDKRNAGGRLRHLCEYLPKRNVMAGSGLDESVASASKLPPDQAIPELRDVILGKHPNDAESIKAKEQVSCVASDGLQVLTLNSRLAKPLLGFAVMSPDIYVPAEIGYALAADHARPTRQHNGPFHRVDDSVCFAGYPAPQRRLRQAEGRRGA